MSSLFKGLDEHLNLTISIRESTPWSKDQAAFTRKHCENTKYHKE